MIRLLDINILVPLLDTDHEKHQEVDEWFEKHRSEGWATCFMTEASAVRLLSILPSKTGGISPTQALSIVDDAVKTPGHVSISTPDRLSQLVTPSMDFIRGHKQLSDTFFLRLAEKNKALFSTFDKGIRVWLPKNHKLHDHLETLEF